MEEGGGLLVMSNDGGCSGGRSLSNALAVLSRSPPPSAAGGGSGSCRGGGGDVGGPMLLPSGKLTFFTPNVFRCGRIGGVCGPVGTGTEARAFVDPKFTSPRPPTFFALGELHLATKSDTRVFCTLGPSTSWSSTSRVVDLFASPQKLTPVDGCFLCFLSRGGLRRLP